MERIAVFGATSAIAKAVVEKWMERGENLILIGRSEKALQELNQILEKKWGRTMPFIVWDILEFDNHQEKFKTLISEYQIRGLFMAVGSMIPQEECDRDPDKTRLLIDANFTGPAFIINLFTEYFKSKNQGFISCISSIAGDRGRGKVLAYGSAKAGLSAYLAGLRHRLAKTNIFIQTIKPGFVESPMTVGLKSLLMVKPEVVAKEIIRALDKKCSVIYTPWYWRGIMLIIKSIPNFIFRNLKF